ncbi:MAG: DUF255 domain-containing protein, partial [Spirochaeta sp.]|nr:DUF255 domain-containing protein [Spirochaeta sp.]
MACDPHRNNLDQARSPYLLQHRDNPVWWQEWNAETLAYAERAGKPLFVSVGYATCHWCHVMAAEAFSDGDVAQYLNEAFVSIKVDREERPDIDHYLMQFLLATRGNGGWPLNAFLAAPRRPVLALTYVPVDSRGGSPGFVEICERVAAFIEEKRGQLQDVTFGTGARDSGDTPETAASNAGHGSAPLSAPLPAAIHRAENLLRRADRQHGGFGTGAKFPPHATLLYLMTAADLIEHDAAGGSAASDRRAMREKIDETVRHTLDVIGQRGLHDHLQGGFFRYCVDPAWQIPHFEKMLYDQAMLLWVYAAAWHRYRDRWYREIVEGIVRALRESFDRNGVFVSAHDADTDHHEGATYLWSDKDLDAALSAEKRGVVSELFELQPGGNFEGSHHLIRRDRGELSADAAGAVAALLSHRRTRSQPEVDRKIVTAWNALAGIGLIVAGRSLGQPEYIAMARRLHDRLLADNAEISANQDGAVTVRLARSSLDGHRSNGEFLEDYAATLLFETYLCEHPTAEQTEHDGANRHALRTALETEVLRFRDNLDGAEEPIWNLARADDFAAVPADEFDAPSPSPIALAELALLRNAQIAGRPVAIPGIDGGQLP